MLCNKRKVHHTRNWRRRKKKNFQLRNLQISGKNLGALLNTKCPIFTQQSDWSVNTFPIMESLIKSRKKCQKLRRMMQHISGKTPHILIASMFIRVLSQFQGSSINSSTCGGALSGSTRSYRFVKRSTSGIWQRCRPYPDLQAKHVLLTKTNRKLSQRLPLHGVTQSSSKCTW